MCPPLTLGSALCLSLGPTNNVWGPAWSSLKARASRARLARKGLLLAPTL